MTMLSNNMSESRSSSLKHRKNMMDAVVVDVYSSLEIKFAAGDAAIARNVVSKWSSFAARNQSSANLGTSLRRTLLSQSSDTVSTTQHGRKDVFQLQQNGFSKTGTLQSIIHTLHNSENPCMDDDVIQGIVLSREDQLEPTNGRMTSIIKIGFADATSNPHYQPGGKILQNPSV